MTMEKTNKYGFAVKTAILSVSLLLLGPQALSPAVGSLIAAFPEVPVEQIRLLVSLPLITLIIFTLVTRFLDKHINMKLTVCIGILVYTLFGAGCFFADTFPALVFGRLAMGVGLGMTATYGVSFISMLFEGRERTTLIGLQSSATNVGSLILTVLAGILSAVSWRHTFLMYLIGIPVLVLVLLFVPSFPPAGADKHEQKAGSGRRGLTAKVKLACVGTFGFFILFFVVFSDFSIRIVTSGLGDASSAGTGLSLLSACALVVSCFYRKISDVAGRWVVPLGVLITAVGFLVIGFAGSLQAASAGAMIAGAGFGIIMPHCYSYAASHTPPGPGQAGAAAAITFATNIASFLSSYVLNGVMMIVSSVRPEVDDYAYSGGIFVAVGFFFMGGVILTVLFAVKSKTAEKAVHIAQ